MAKNRYQPPFAAGVLIMDSDGRILAVSRQKVRKRTAKRLDWGIPAGHAEVAEHPMQTAQRELYEETGLSVADLSPLLTVPPMGARTIPLHVYTPLGPVMGQLTSSGEGVAAWVFPADLLEVRDPQLSVADSNRFILYWGLGMS